MLAVKVVQKGKVELINVPDPVPGPGDVLLRIRQCGICGSDLHIYRGEWNTDTKIGHEICAVVEQAGPDVTGFPPGMRVCAECFSHCGKCRYCQAGDYNLCESVSFLPGHEHSGLAQKAMLPAHTLFKVPDSLSDAQVMMVEPTAVAFRAVSRAIRIPGMFGLSSFTLAPGMNSAPSISVAPCVSLGIIGAGTIGLLCTAAAKAAGASPVAVVAKHPHQADMAARLGADHVIRIAERSVAEAMAEATGGRGFDAIVDTVARGTSFSSALGAVRSRGRVVLLGGVTRPMLINIWPVEGRELEVTGSQCYALTNGKPDFESAIQLIESGRVDAGSLVTHTLPLENVDEAFRIANDKSAGSLKVAVRLSD